MDYETRTQQETDTKAPACQICRERAVVQVPLKALRPQTVRRYIFGPQSQTREVALCGVCQLLHCEETLEGDGPVRKRPNDEKQLTVSPQDGSLWPMRIGRIWTARMITRHRSWGSWSAAATISTCGRTASR